VPAVGMGTWRTFDVRGVAAERQAGAIVDEALAVGACFIDSSPMYGEAERVLGRTLANHRADALVATKVWTRDAAEGHAQIERAGLLRWPRRPVPDTQPCLLAHAPAHTGAVA